MFEAHRPYTPEGLHDRFMGYLWNQQDGRPVKVSDNRLICEAVEVNHQQLNDEKTKAKYEKHLRHFSEFLDSKCEKDFYTAERSDVLRFMEHLKGRGGATPARSRAGCSWCATRGYPDGRGGIEGWSASTRKGYLSALRFLYEHFQYEPDLPPIDPTRGVKSPRVTQKYEYIPTSDEIARFLAVSGSPNETLLAHWIAYVPERRETFRRARWRDIDLEQGTWRIFEGKNGRSSQLILHPLLVRQLRFHRNHMEREAEHNLPIKRALQDEETAFILLTKNGKPLHPSTVTKLVKQRGIRAGVGIVSAPGQYGSVDGRNSRMTPHALRRGWATNALNNGQSLDVVRDALGHADSSTTERHYAKTTSDRVASALLSTSY